MPNLKTNITNAKTTQELANILRDTEAHLSFFGSESLKSTKDNSYVSISFVTRKALTLLQPYLKNWNYSFKERRDISFVMNKIDSSYAKIDEALHIANFFTNFFNWLRQLPCIIFSIRRKWENMPDLSNFYTEKQYREAFPRNTLPEEADDEYKKLPLFLPPDKINQPWYLRFLNLVTSNGIN